MTVQKIEVSHRTIIFTVLFLLGLNFLFEIRQILILLFVSFVLVSSLNPLVDNLTRLHLPRFIAILFVYVVIAAAIVLAVVGIAPLVVAQTVTFSERLPDLLHQFQSIGISKDALGTQLGQLWSVPLDLLRVTVDLFNNILNFVVVIAITFYLLLERNKLDDYLTTLFGPEQKEAKKIVEELEGRLGGWVRGEVILMTTVGVLSYLGFKILGLDFALPLAVLAGILEIIPNVGPIVAALVAVLGALSISPAIALAVLAWAFIIQQVEAHILVPKVMQSATGVHPVISITALLIGLKLAGTSGAILAIPLVLVLDVALREILVKRGIVSRTP